MRKGRPQAAPEFVLPKRPISRARGSNHKTFGLQRREHLGTCKFVLRNAIDRCILGEATATRVVASFWPGSPRGGEVACQCRLPAASRSPSDGLTDSSTIRRMRLQGRDHLRPDRDHPQKQRQRGQRGGFRNNSTNHDDSPNITGTLFLICSLSSRGYWPVFDSVAGFELKQWLVLRQPSRAAAHDAMNRPAASCDHSM
jgi:hypothetical protein